MRAHAAGCSDFVNLDPLRERRKLTRKLEVVWSPRVDLGCCAQRGKPRQRVQERGGSSEPSNLDSLALGILGTIGVPLVSNHMTFTYHVFMFACAHACMHACTPLIVGRSWRTIYITRRACEPCYENSTLGLCLMNESITHAHVRHSVSAEHPLSSACFCLTHV